METTMIYPDPITAEQITFLTDQRKITPIIAALDFSMIKMKLQEPEEGEDWTPEQCESAEVEYKRYLQLCKTYGPGIVPNKIMDTFWHYHILDTRAYHTDCDLIFGGYLHHYPYFGMRGEQDATDLEQGFILTKQRYLETFGEEMSRKDQAMKCWHDCQNRCWNACQSGK